MDKRLAIRNNDIFYIIIIEHCKEQERILSNYFFTFVLINRIKIEQ